MAPQKTVLGDEVKVPRLVTLLIHLFRWIIGISVVGGVAAAGGWWIVERTGRRRWWIARVACSVTDSRVPVHRHSRWNQSRTTAETHRSSLAVCHGCCRRSLRRSHRLHARCPHDRSMCQRVVGCDQQDRLTMALPALRLRAQLEQQISPDRPRLASARTLVSIPEGHTPLGAGCTNRPHLAAIRPIDRRPHLGTSQRLWALLRNILTAPGVGHIGGNTVGFAARQPPSKSMFLDAMQAPRLPTGTVSLLFTDIEASTRLWQELPEGMPSALADHDQLLQEIVESSGGHVVKSTGDGIYAVFGRARQAIEAAVASQMKFLTTEFADVGHLKVRMAIHTGEADERQGDYFGSVPNRASRLLAVGHGGQILTSAATREILGDTNFEFVDLGEHRLRDLARPEHVYQIRHQELPSEFPPLSSVDAHPNNFPIQLTSFVGRIHEVREVSKALDDTRLITLTGTGGTGKTRLSLQVGAELLDSFSDGAWLVEFAPVSDPDLVAAQVAEVFGVSDMETESGRSLVDVLADYLSDKETLLILDNCEHVVEACATVTESLLSRCPGLRILATSRELLGVPGEVVYAVPPLGLPASEVEEVGETEAVRLFADRAAHVLSSFRLSHENSSVVHEIVGRLDGLPLAIELAASRSNLLTPEQMLDHLDNQFQADIGSPRSWSAHDAANGDGLEPRPAVAGGAVIVPPVGRICGRLVAGRGRDCLPIMGLDRYPGPPRRPVVGRRFPCGRVEPISIPRTGPTIRTPQARRVWRRGASAKSPHCLLRRAGGSV